MIVALSGLFSYLFCDCGTPWTLLLPFLTTCLWLGPGVVQLLVFIYSGIGRISHGYSSLFIIVINLIFMFSH